MVEVPNESTAPANVGHLVAALRRLATSPAGRGARAAPEVAVATQLRD